MTSTRSSRPTLRKVADHAQVALSTASLVFSGKGPVAAETAERVRAAASELGYAGPDPLASSLRQGRAGVVGVSIAGPLRAAFADPYAITVLDGLAQELAQIPAGMLLLDHADDPAHGQLLAVDAMVFPLCGAPDTDLVGTLTARGIPMAATGAPIGRGIVQVVIDERAATAEATNHLLALGHRQIAHLAMPLTRDWDHSYADTAGIGAQLVTRQRLEQATYVDSRDRALGFWDCCQGGRVVEAGAASVEGALAAAALLLDGDERPTAVVAQSDLMAAGVIHAATERGLAVPEDLSVVGFDGIPVPWLDGELTTIVQPGVDKGRALGAAVRALLDGRRPRSRTLPTRLQVGTTTSVPHRRRR